MGRTATKAVAKEVPTTTAPPDEGQKKSVQVPELKIVRATIDLIGDSPLLMHRFGEEQKSAMAARQQQQVRQKKAPKDPIQCFLHSMHVIEGEAGKPGCRYGFPSVGFKKSVVTAAVDADWKKTEVRRAFHVDGDYVEIVFDGEPRMQEDAVRNSGKVADLRYRAAFDGWRARVPITYNAQVMTPETLVYLFNLAGFGVGIGEHRPERDGQNGRFHVAVDGEWERANSKGGDVVSIAG